MSTNWGKADPESDAISGQSRKRKFFQVSGLM
jgi:hypothetical protein